ncbi:MAG TPA: ATP-binding protein [Candidatus Limnocylindrales bacterium]|nr:ATP-binding protein [Candidatus Limnocylindrales bacterium]
MGSSSTSPTAYSGAPAPVFAPPLGPHACPAGEGEVPEHYVQFFEHDEVLLTALFEFVTEGLADGEACIVVGTSAHNQRLHVRLTDAGIDLASASETGQLTMLDASELLEKMLVDGFVDRDRFRTIVGRLVESSFQRYPRVRVFGEMVALLWARGSREAAIELEERWNELLKERSFTLFCAYPFHGMSGLDAAPPFEKVCRSHSRIIPPESFSRLDSAEDRLHSIVEWQHKAQLLELEVHERQRAETALSRVNAMLEQQVEDLRQLHELSAKLTENLDIASVLEVALRGALAVQGTDMGLLSLCETTREGLTLKAHNGFDAKFLREVAWVPPGGGSCGSCLTMRRRIVVEDTETDPLFAEHRGAARRAGFRACHSTPLITRAGKIIGVLSVHFRQPHRPSDREMQLMDLFSQMAANAIENVSLHRQAQHELEERHRLLRLEQDARTVSEKASRLKDEFLATVSHELRTPLTSIIGWAHMLRDDSLDPAIAERAVETIERAATTQAQLIEDILDVSRIITGNLKVNVAPVDPLRVIEGATSALELAARSKLINLSVVIGPAGIHGDKPILGDAIRLQQVVWNLVSNAIKFTSSGGRVDVRLTRDESELEIQVIDNGEGIEPEFIPYLFDRFRQADGSSTRRHQGLGLGLAIVRHLVELHGGTVRAESEGPGHGATFTVRLPMLPVSRVREVAPVRASDEATASPGRAGQLEGMRILLVDNDADTLAMLCAILGEQRAEVRTAGSAAEAFEILRWYQPSVVISDLAMPGEDGYSFIRRLRAREQRGGRQIPAIALTGYVRVEDRRAALEAGFNVFVPKPVEPSELIATISNFARTMPVKACG